MFVERGSDYVTHPCGGFQSSPLCTLSNELHASADVDHSDHLPWLVTSVAPNFSVFIESCAKKTVTTTRPNIPLFDSTSDACGALESFTFPCRNAVSELQRHQLFDSRHRKVSPTEVLSERLTIVKAASSVTSDQAVKHQPTAARVVYGTRLPTIALLAHSEGDGRRFVIALTPYDPSRVNPLSSSVPNPLPTTRHADPNGSLNVSAIPVVQQSLLDKQVHNTTMRPDDGNRSLNVNLVDDSNASSVLDAKHRPEGIAYTMTICQVAPSSQHIFVNNGGTVIGVFKGSDLVEGGSDGAVCLPLFLSAPRRLAVIRIRLVTTSLDVPLLNRSTNADRSIVYVSSAQCSLPRLRFCNQRSQPFEFVVLLSDGVVIAFACQGPDKSDIDAMNTFSPTEADVEGGHDMELHPVAVCGTCAPEQPTPNLHKAVEVALCRRKATPNNNSVSTNDVQYQSPTRNTSKGKQLLSLSLLSRSTMARVSANGGVLCFAATQSNTVVFVPLRHGQSAISVELPIPKNAIIEDVVFAAEATWSGVFVSVAVSSSPELITLWWCSPSGSCAQVEERNWFMVPTSSYIEVPQLPHGLDKDVTILQRLTSPMRRETITVASDAKLKMLLSAPSLLSSDDSGKGSRDHVCRIRSVDTTTGTLLDLLFTPTPSLQRQVSVSLRSPSLIGLKRLVENVYGGSVSCTGDFSLLLTSLPKSGPQGLFEAASVVTVSTYVTCLEGTIPMGAPMMEAAQETPLVRIEGAGSPEGLFKTQFAEEVQLLRRHVFEMLAVYGCSTTTLDLAALICASPLHGTWEASLIADTALCSIAAHPTLADYFLPVATGVPCNEIVAILLQSCSSSLSMILTWGARQAANAARLVAIEATAANVAPSQITTATTQPKLNPRSHSDVEAAILLFSNNSNSTSNTTQNNNGITSLPCTPQEWKSCLPYLLLKYGAQPLTSLIDSLCIQLTPFAAAQPTVKGLLDEIKGSRTCLQLQLD